MSYSPNFRGVEGKGSSRSLQTNYQNGEVSLLSKGTPVSINGSGQMIGVDVSNEQSVLSIIGLIGQDTPGSSLGPVADSGRVENVITSYPVGTSLYISKSGALTDQKPSVGVGGFIAGDFVIFAGVIIANEYNNILKDIKVLILVIGQL